MFCTRCGAARVQGAAFCSNCGAAFDPPPPPPPQAPTPPPGEAPVGYPPGAAVAAEPRRPRAALWVAVATALVVLLTAVGAGAVVLTRQLGGSTAEPPRPPRSVPPSVSTGSTSAPPSSASSTPAAPPSEQSFADLYRNVSDGVIRIETTACEGGGVGSGFLVAPDMVATVAHVVSGAASVVVRDGSLTTTGTVVGFDPDAELALVRTRQPLPGHVFELGAASPAVGTDVGAIGYPLGGPKSLSTGAVSGVGRRIDVEGHQLSGLVQTDASLNPGNSGGPLLTLDGTVVGIVEAKRTDAENVGYAIRASRAAAPLRGWMTSPTPVHWVDHCSAPTGPDGVSVDIADRSGHPDGAAIAQAFSRYVDGINSGDYAAAYAVLSPRERQKIAFSDFAEGTTSSYIVELSVDAISPNGAADRVEVRFTSVQQPAFGAHGQSCSHWRMTYSMVRPGAKWLIDSATPHTGSPTPC